MSTGIVIGRFAPPQSAEVALVARALASHDRVVVVLGSSFHARTPRDPFDWRERSEMVRLATPEANRSRLAFMPVRDYYDEARWSGAVAAAVDGVAPGAHTLYVPDDARAERYADAFPHWKQAIIECPPPERGSRLRQVFLQHDMARSPAGLAERRDGALAVLSAWVPKPVIEYLRAWGTLPAYAALVRDQQALDAMNDEWKGSPYEPIFSTVDAVVRCAGHVLLVRRGSPPGQGLWALPGGFLEPRETLLESAMRELREETGLGAHPSSLRRALTRVAVFSHPERSLRGRTITHAHFFELRDERLPAVKGGDDAAAAEWISLDALPGLEAQLFEDHFHILDEFLRLT
jgi:bifunctional NMN adenylyltransferase/nudix hydrolase